MREDAVGNLTRAQVTLPGCMAQLDRIRSARPQSVKEAVGLIERTASADPATIKDIQTYVEK